MAPNAKLSLPSPLPDALLILKRLSRICASLVFAIGFITVLAWLFHPLFLGTVFPPDRLPFILSIKCNTGLGFVLIGAALWLSGSERPISQGWELFRKTAAFSAAFLGGATLFEYVTGWNLGLDQLFTPDATVTGNFLPGRMGAGTAVDFSLMGLAFAFPGLKIPRKIQLASFFSLASLFIGLLAFIGHLYGAKSLYVYSPYNYMALQTSLAFILSAVGFLTAYPRRIFGFRAGGSLEIPINDSNSKGFGSFAWTGLSMILVFLLASAWISTENFFGLLQNNHRVVHSQLVLDSLEKVRASVSAQTDALHDYFLDGRTADREKFGTAKGQFQECLDSTMALTLDNARQQQRLTDMGRLIDANAKTLGPWLAKRSTLSWGPTDQNHVQILADRFQARYRDLLVAIRQEENDLLALRAEEADQSIRQTGWAFVFTFATALLFILFTLLLWRQDNRLQQQLRESEDKLRTSEANYREIFDKANDGIIITDPEAMDNPILDMNASLERMTGFTLAEYQKVPAHKLFSELPGSTAADYALLAHKALTDGPQIFEWQALHRDGHPYWIEVGLQKTVLAGKTRLMAITRDISDRKRLQEINRLGEARAIENIKDYAILMLDREGRILTWNQGAENIKGYKRSEIVGKPVSVFYTPEDIARGHWREMLETAAERGSFEEEGWRVRKDGSRFLADVNLTALRDEKGELLGFIKVTRDVTQTRRAERELREKTELLDSILKNIADGVVVADDQGKFLLFNPAAQKISGRSGEGAILGQWNEQFGVFRPDKTTLFPDEENPLAKAVQGEATDNVEMYLRNSGHPEGVLVSASGRPLKDEKGKQRGGVAIFRDVTEQKRFEEKIQEANDFLNAVLENLPNMVFVKDAKDLKFVMFNKAGEDLLGISRADLIGKNDYDFFPKAEADFFTAQDRKTLGGKKLVDIPEEAIQTQKKGKRVLHTRKIPVLGPDGVPRYLLGISEDITEQKQQEDLRIYAKALEASNKDLQDFIFVASHDLQEPLRKIQAFGNFLDQEDGKSLSAAGQDYLKRIRDASMRMSALLSDLLDLTRISTRAKPFEKVDLNEIVQEVTSDLEMRLRETGGKIEVGPLPVIGADPSQMRQLFQNLIANSLKFHRPGQAPVIHITAEASEVEADCRLVIRDNGIGFDPKYAEKIFNIFQRLHGQGQYPGTGIGLAICRKVVERHGGRIMAESVEGQGAVFRVTLPLRRVLPVEVEKRDEAI
jgi:PAS domain S-box-containing protein